MNDDIRVEPHQADNTLAELFHLVGSLIPQNHKIKVARRDTTVAQAIATMRECHYSQLPVVSGKAVLGVFSYRSLAVRLLENAPRMEEFVKLPVEEFMETNQYVQPSQNWESILDHLNRDDAVLVGHRDDLQGILTALDVLNYLHSIARPFVILAVLETTLRRLIRACVDDQTLQKCVEENLSSKYAEDRLPSKLEDMEFNDYTQIICHGRNWIHFTQVFGTTEYQRKDTQYRLTQIRELRNTVFHFKRVLVQADHDKLAEQQEWLEMKARAFEGSEKEDAIKAEDGVGDRDEESKGPWNERTFLTDLDKRDSGAVSVAQRILVWARNNGSHVWWGNGKVTGSFVPSLRHKGIYHQLFAVWTNGTLQFYFPTQGRKTPFNSPPKLQEFIAKVSVLPGISLPDDADKRYVSVPLTSFQYEANLQQLLAIFDWVILEIQSS